MIVDLLMPFDEPRKLELGEPAVSEYGFSLIDSMLRRKYGEGLPSGFPREYVTGMGKLASRIDKFMHMYYGVDIQPSVKEEIGNIASEHTAMADTVIYDVTSRIMEWPAGSFGNTKSCYRLSHKQSVAALKEAGALAFRLFKPGGHFYGKYRGAGRAWVVPYDSGLVVFNGYGMKSTADFASMISTITNTPYEKVSRVRSSDGMIYVNNSSGYMVGRNVPREVNISVSWVNMETCISCGKQFIFKRSDVDWCRRDERYFCKDCTAVCEIQKQRFPESELIYAPGAVVVHQGNEIEIRSHLHERYENYLATCPKCDSVFGKTQRHSC